ncbi:MAG: hypothetical protein MMC33_004742 [Icmadophila ericetorum]|nr:hypothetical protein [Icmadophila ericetorum]
MPGDPAWEANNKAKKAATAAKKAATMTKKKQEEVNKANKRKRTASVTVKDAAAASRKRQRAKSAASTIENPAAFPTNISIFFNKIVLKDKEATLSSCFIFQEFYSSQLKLASNYATIKGYLLNLISLDAVVKAGSGSHATASRWLLNDPGDWATVKTAIELLRKEGLKRINVDLVAKYSRHPPENTLNANDSDQGSIEEEEELDQSSDDLLEPENSQKKTKQRQTPTVKLLKEAKA